MLELTRRNLFFLTTDPGPAGGNRGVGLNKGACVVRRKGTYRERVLIGFQNFVLESCVRPVLTCPPAQVVP